MAFKVLNIIALIFHLTFFPHLLRIKFRLTLEMTLFVQTYSRKYVSQFFEMFKDC